MQGSSQRIGPVFQPGSDLVVQMGAKKVEHLVVILVDPVNFRMAGAVPEIQPMLP